MSRRETSHKINTQVGLSLSVLNDCRGHFSREAQLPQRLHASADITPFKVIQGHLCWHQSKACTLHCILFYTVFK